MSMRVLQKANCHKCDKCNYMFSAKGTNKEHTSAEHKKNIQTCEACDKTVSSKGILKAHMIAEHRKNCNVCDKTFAQKALWWRVHGAWVIKAFLWSRTCLVFGGRNGSRKGGGKCEFRLHFSASIVFIICLFVGKFQAWFICIIFATFTAFVWF